jgi:GT2 family glycosyltransferase
MPGKNLWECIESSPKVSIILINWKNEKYTKPCVESLRKITYPNYEIIIVDNESKGKLRYRDKRIKVVKSKTNLGFSIANNVGVHYATGELVLILNNDTTVEPGFLEPLVAELGEGVGMTTPIIFYPDGTLAYAGGALKKYGTYHIGHGQEKPHFMFLKNREVDYATGCCFLMKRKFYQDLGGFDEYMFIYLEDVDLSLRVRHHGFTINCIPASKIVHHEGVSTKKRNSRFFRRLGEHHILYIAKKHGFLETEYLIRDAAHAAKIIGESVLGDNFKEALGVIEGKADFWRNWR